jgi:hypothetical protein
MVWVEMYEAALIFSSFLFLLFLFIVFLQQWEEKGTDLDDEQSNSIIFVCNSFSCLSTASSLSYLDT